MWPMNRSRRLSLPLSSSMRLRKSTSAASEMSLLPDAKRTSDTLSIIVSVTGSASYCSVLPEECCAAAKTPGPQFSATLGAAAVTTGSGSASRISKVASTVTRRLSAIPSGVELSATGIASPKPTSTMVLWSIPRASPTFCATRSARASDKPWLSP